MHIVPSRSSTDLVPIDPGRHEYRREPANDGDWDFSPPEAERSMASSSNARGACDCEELAAKHNQALWMTARLLSFGFSLLLQLQNMCA
jgi:hypothetical protein